MIRRTISRRNTLGWMAAVTAIGAFARRSVGATRPPRVFDVHDHGAVGDGVALDTAAIQRAVDAAAAWGKGARVLLRAGRKYLIGPVRLAGGIDFHLAGDAEIMVSADPAHYGTPQEGVLSLEGVLHAVAAIGLTISGTGVINGRSPEFMSGFDAENEWWTPKPFRPRLLVLENCENLVIRDVTFSQAPSWTVHLLGCRHVLIDHVSIHNQPDVPNCDGIDPDHCQHVEIRNCHIVCGDDAIVIKTTAGHPQYGPSHNITVRDCVLETQDSGLKIGTETTQDIHQILFERCRIVTGCRGLCIQLRDQGSVYDIVYRDITFVSRYFSAPWWGRGEAISFTAIPRTPATTLGTIHDVLVQNVTGRAENSIRIQGHGASRIRNVTLDRVKVTLDRWTKYPGGVFDNRPTSTIDPIEKHGTPGMLIRHADHITLDHCTVEWGGNRPGYFTHALQVEGVTALVNTGFVGEAAHPARDPAILVTNG